MRQPKLSEKQEQAKPKIHRWREITKIRAKINEVVTKNNYTKNHQNRKNKIWFFEQLKKRDLQILSQSEKKEEEKDTN
jgi:hypothetical protein